LGGWEGHNLEGILDKVMKTNLIRKEFSIIRAQEKPGEKELLLENESQGGPSHTHDGVSNVASTVSRGSTKEVSPERPRTVVDVPGRDPEPQAEVMINALKPGLIHEECFFDFWKNDLKANDWVLNTLRKGYMIPFTK